MEAGKDTMTIGVAVVIVTASAMEIAAVAIVMASAMEKATVMEKTAMGIAIDIVKAGILEVGAAAIVAMETAEIMETVGTTMTGTTMKTEILKIGIMRARKKASTETTARQMVLQFLNPPSARKAGGIARHLHFPSSGKVFLRKISVPEVAI